MTTAFIFCREYTVIEFVVTVHIREYYLCSFKVLTIIIGLGFVLGCRSRDFTT